MKIEKNNLTFDIPDSFLSKFGDDSFESSLEKLLPELHPPEPQTPCPPGNGWKVCYYSNKKLYRIIRH